MNGELPYGDIDPYGLYPPPQNGYGDGILKGDEEPLDDNPFEEDEGEEEDDLLVSEAWLVDTRIKAEAIIDKNLVIIFYYWFGGGRLVDEGLEMMKIIRSEEDLEQQKEESGRAKRG